LLFSVNITLLAMLSSIEKLVKTTTIMITAFLKSRLLTPLIIQQKIKK